MIKASLLYPNTEGAGFDFTYWTESHLPFIRRSLSPDLKGLTADRGLAGAPGTPPPYIASGHLFFESVEALEQAYAPHAAAIAADIKNFTDLQPVMIVSEILVD